MVFISMKIKLFIILSIVTFPLRMEIAIAKRPIAIAQHSIAIANRSIEIAQPTQPRQTPIQTTTKPVNKNPTIPTTKPVTPVDDSGETPTAEETEEPVEPEEAEQRANDLDNKISPKNQNPFSKPDIDKLLTNQFNDDMWRIMRGGLPCLETTSSCLEQLQNKSVTDSPLLKELDTRIQEATSKIDEARSKNAKTVRLSVLTPALQYLLGPAVTAGQAQPEGKGLIDNLSGIFNGETGLINGLLNVIGVPLFVGSQGANTEANRNAIAISDLQIKVAELQRARAQLADTIRGKVAVALVKFDEGRTDFQIAQVVGARAIDQFKVFELRYIRGNNDTESYLAKQSQLDRVKADTYASWGKMRRSLFEIKLLVLGVKDAEI